MASSAIEQQRAALEELEILETFIADALDAKPKAVKGCALTDFRAAACMLLAQDVAADALKSRAPGNDAQLAELLGSAAGETEGDSAGKDIMGTFYQRLEELRLIHRSQSSSTLTAPATGSSYRRSTDMEEAAQAALASFTAEEHYGRFVDASALFEEFSNLPLVRDARFIANSEGRAAIPDDTRDVLDAACADYATYLAKMVDLHAGLPARVKCTRAYKRYIVSLSRYLLHFLQRRGPLLDASVLLQSWQTEFGTAWEQGACAGWAAGDAHGDAAEEADPSHHASTGVSSSSVMDLTSFDSAESIVEALGADGCKVQLLARGLKAGGSPLERAERLWTVRSMQPDQYPKKLRATGPVTQQKGLETEPVRAPQSSASTSSPLGSGSIAAVKLLDPAAWGAAAFGAAPAQSAKSAAWVEFVALQCARVLGDVLADTKRRVQFRATRTHAELQADREAEEMEASVEPGDIGANGAGQDDDDAGGTIYNPLNIPLGWDGKPIPYWLYRLHGLNVEYTCEICGGTVYRGRRDFDRHFQEWRHAQGMRALGIPNTKHFHDITKIQDAKDLYSRIKSVLDKETWKSEGPAGEEFEDSQGNVLGKKTYEDLARHGLL